MADEIEKDEKDVMVDDTVIADDKTKVTEPIKDEKDPLESTAVSLDDKITASKLQTIEEQNAIIIANQATIMQALADIQGKLQLEFRTQPSETPYQTILKQVMNPTIG